MAELLPLREKYLKRLEALRVEQSTWRNHWMEISDLCLPRRSRFLTTDRNRGSKKNAKIYNNAAGFALRTLASGMMTGITSPARSWFRLGTFDLQLAEHADIKSWLYDLEDTVRTLFHRSNIYNSFATFYEDIGAFGTAAMGVEEDEEDVIRTYVYPIGSYFVAANAIGKIDVFYRETSLNVEQLVTKFGLGAVSMRVRDLWREGSKDTWIDCCQVIEPNPEYALGREDSMSLKYRGLWFEKAAGVNETNYVLWAGGFAEFPVMVARWNTTGEDFYGRGPGMDALPDMKSMQAYEKRMAQVLDLHVRPPMQAPSSLRMKGLSTLSGDINYYDSASAHQKIEPAVQTDPTALDQIRLAIRDTIERVSRAFYSDVFLAISESDTRQRTAEEIRARQDEKALQFGPVLERLYEEFLSAMMDRVLPIVFRRQMIAPAPPGLQGQELNVQFVSILRQAQNAQGTAGIEHMTAYTSGLAQTVPEVLDVVDFDYSIEEMGRLMGTPPKLVRDPEAVAALRASRAQQQQIEKLAAAAQPAMHAAKAAESMSKIPAGGDNALSAMLGAGQ